MTAPAFQPADRRARGTRARQPRLRAVLLEQVRATGFLMRRPALIAAILAVLTLLSALQSASREVPVTLYQWPTVLPGLMGAMLPIAVWARDERFGPGFLWTLPVDRRWHALTKVLAGWAWLMGGVVLFSLWSVAHTLISGGQVLPPETLHVVSVHASPRIPLDPAALRTVRWVPGPLIWVVPFTAATTCYLLASALVLGSRRPLHWVTGTVLSYTLLAVAGEPASAKLGVGWLADAPERLLGMLLDSRYGLDALLTARIDSLSITATLTTGGRIMVWRGVPGIGDWLAATLLWGGAGLLALWTAASRHRERRPA